MRRHDQELEEQQQRVALPHLGELGVTQLTQRALILHLPCQVRVRARARARVRVRVRVGLG